MSDTSERVVPSDEAVAEIGFGHGGVPWYLLVFYLSFLCFFVWYVLEYQLPDYLAQEAPAEAPAEPASPR